jgi:hypothetical protein
MNSPFREHGWFRNRWPVQRPTAASSIALPEQDSLEGVEPAGTRSPRGKLPHARVSSAAPPPRTQSAHSCTLSAPAHATTRFAPRRDSKSFQNDKAATSGGCPARPHILANHSPGPEPRPPHSVLTTAHRSPHSRLHHNRVTAPPPSLPSPPVPRFLVTATVARRHSGPRWLSPLSPQTSTRLRS